MTFNKEQEKVTVTGNFESSIFVKKLRKSEKHAELYQLPKLPIYTTEGQQNPFIQKQKTRKYNFCRRG
ncbi:hypothetical protein IEQ34_009004 [Dendrobium chrysotoxum]|uniref:Ribosomal protein L33 n=1 Tax=Dendrobium chrysotoxum TaxID=161865 RepID=A0AAV7GI36_DENCH|nr:hypothetical protein IEQ34_009004 [Dendrobium chrysotoxum]